MLQDSPIHLGILYIGKQGGICQYTYELVRVISKVARVTCYLSANNVMQSQWRELPCQVKTFETYSGFSSLLWSMIDRQKQANVAEVIQADRPDILLDTGSGPWGGVIKKAMRSKPLLVDTIHDVEIHPDRWWLFLKIYQFFYPTIADALVGISDYSCQQMKVKFPNTPIVKSLHGVIHASDAIDLNRIANNRNKFLFFGRIEGYKGLNILVDAFQIAKQIHPDISLTIAGKGPIEDRVKSLILQLGIQSIDRWIPDDELSEIIADCGVMVMPYLSATQSGVAAVALGNGMPSIATDVGALPEQIIDRKNGIIVPPNDVRALAAAMVDFAKQDYESVYRMAEAASLMAATTYSWEEIGNNLLADLTCLAKQANHSIETFQATKLN